MEENKLVIVKDNEIVIDNDFIERYRNFKKVQLEMDLIEKDFKAQLKSAMEYSKDSSVSSSISIEVE